MPQSGDEQVWMVSEAEATYGEEITSPTFAAVGFVGGGEAAASTEDKSKEGIGRSLILWPGRVENSARVEVTAPSADVINYAVRDLATGVLPSYNIAVGQHDAAWRGVGAMADGFDLTISAEEEPLGMTMDWLYQSLLTALEDAGDADPEDPTLWLPSGLVVSIGTTTWTDGVPSGGSYVPDTDFISGSISLKNNIERKYSGGSRVCSNLKPKRQVIESTIMSYALPTFNLEAACPSRQVAVKYVFTDVCGGATPDTLTVELLGGIYRGKTLPVKPWDDIDYQIRLGFTAIIVS